MSPTRVEVIADRYELTGEVLASGGMGRVISGRDRVLDRPVAIKVLATGIGDAPGARKRFRSEAVNAARLSHPNVVAVYDAGEHDGHAYIVMERLPGRTLADELDGGRVSQERAVVLVQQVLSALQAAHDAGIVHRDVKPGNVLIADDGSARLSDFGIAKLLEQDATRTRDLLGTPAYVAPELLEGHRASPQSDLYAVGIILFEALAGRKPFAGEPSVAHLAAVQSGRLPSVRDVAPWIGDRIAAVVDRATHRDPMKRFSSAAAMSGTLTALAQERSGVDATVPIAPPKPLDATAPFEPSQQVDATVQLHRPTLDVRRRRKVPRWALLSAAITVAAGGAIVVVALGDTQNRAPSGPPGTRGTAAPRTTVGPEGATTLPLPLASALDELDRAVSGP